ncbi:ran-binding protein [Grosmannia clavigera kw1407]|uniref:Ran-binding protein n=1 Tax=Grosmannia clavigera (strain kw1407 / UAMH 11150) TaxID=655863 RepID=F0XEQ8_GROCL|nr:ran-binding protein [Grosmannia clavigera kw1407]EFX04282.1 ran-binding protein [Grosmannia clavigera kw1407]
MSDPYQIPPSAFQDDPTSNLSGFNLRRSSYASVASGPGSFARSGANFAQLLNPTSSVTVDGSDGSGNGASNINSSSSLRGPYGADTEGRGSFEASGGGLYQILGTRNTQLPSFSHAFEHLLCAPPFETYTTASMAFDVVEKSPGTALLDDDEAMTPLPSRWDKKDKPQSGLEVLSGGLDVKYMASSLKGTGDREQDLCSIRADHYMPPQCGIYYFEVTVLGKHKGESTVGIGFSDASASLTRQPGWEPKSWGYHSDDGNIFYANSQGKSYGPPFGPGDVVGCGVNFRTGAAFYTKNGENQGVAFPDIRGSNLKLFPTVGLKKSGEHIRVNFGQSPFTFDIDGMMKEERNLIDAQIRNTGTKGLAPHLGETELIQQLVLQFLQHDGYVETARAFADEIREEKASLNLNPANVVKGISITDDEDANNRQRIRRAILEGDIDRALKLTKFYYPHVLEANEQVYFRLRCRKFVEMIRKEAELNLVGRSSSSNGGISTASAVVSGSGKQSNGRGRTDSHLSQQDMDIDDIDMVEDGTDGLPPSQSVVDEAIAYGQALQSEYINDARSEIRSALGEIFSLLAYTNPLKEKGVAHLLDQRGRVAVAEELNSAILQSLGKSSRAALENLYAQTSVLLEDIRQDGGPGSFVTIQGVVDRIPSSSNY